MDAFLAEKETLLGDIVAAIDVAEEAGVNEVTEAAIEAAIQAYNERCQILWSQLMGGEVVLNDGLEVRESVRRLSWMAFFRKVPPKTKHPIAYVCNLNAHS